MNYSAAKPQDATKKKTSDDEIIEAYRRLGSVWKVADELGVCGQTVSNRLKKAGAKTNKRWLSDDDRQKIREFYEHTPPDQFDLEVISKQLGRTKAVVCREAARLGLTDLSRPNSHKGTLSVLSARRDFWKTRGHPRGMAGKKHTEKTIEIMSASSKRMWATHKAFGIGLMSEENRQKLSDSAALRFAATSSSNCYSRCKHGRRDDLGEPYFRSSWEANYARYLNMLMKMKVVERWEYEPQTFWFEPIKRGVRSYRPDFFVKYRNDDKPVYVEVKGWLDDKSKTKLKRMKLYYPHIKIEFVGEKEYRAIARKWANAIANWEGSSK